jgi:hypothetical protein
VDMRSVAARGFAVSSVRFPTRPALPRPVGQDARAARSSYAAKANATTRAVIVDIQRAAVSTLAAIAKTLEARGVRTPAGRSTWQPVQVSRLLAL